jgi:archaellum component FlaF (FlaF/FlaG flagellin family)
MGHWGEGGEAHFEPFTQLGGASILNDIVLEVTLLDGSLADISVSGPTSYVFPGDTVTITTPNITA